jgi:hypothetical protein
VEHIHPEDYSIMCYYSLHSIPNRFAVQGESLVLIRFSTGSNGFASADERKLEEGRGAPAKANFLSRAGGFLSELWQRAKWSEIKDAHSHPQVVCLPHGVTLRITDAPSSAEQQIKFGAMVGRKVRLIQTTPEPHSYRDAIEYPDSPSDKPISVQDLPPGMVVEVLSLNFSAEGDPQPRLTNAAAAFSRR